MQIAGVNTALSAVTASEPASMSNAVGLKMLSNALDMGKVMSDGLTKMMERSVNPHIGGNIDVSV
ncbi:MAG: YjfB family protein [Agathobacter sp.]|nr:YjfB family protein [Agathobacter sp.]